MEDNKQEDMLKKEQILNRAIIDSIPGTFYVLDKNGQYVRWNSYQRDEIVGKTDDLMANTSALDTIHSEDKDFIQSKIANVLINGEAETVEGRVLLRGGPEFRWLIMTGQRMMIDGSPFLVGIGVDITERKKIEESNRKKLEEMENMNKLMIGREIKMIELKKEIADLKAKSTKE